MSPYVAAFCWVLALLCIGTTTTITGTNAQQQVASVATPATVSSGKWRTEFTPTRLEVHMNTKAQVFLEITDIDTTQQDYVFQLKSKNPGIASVDLKINSTVINPVTRSWSGNVSIDAIFLGNTTIYVERIDAQQNIDGPSVNSSSLNLIIIRNMRVIDHVFTGCVALLVSLLYINFGCALNLSVLRSIIVRPVGPAIGFASQFIIMPLLSYFLGYIIFPDSVEMQLGMFFTGVSPSGGASNIWAVILGGNIDLSVLMTTISNFAAFAMMPLWLFTLGAVIFDRGNLEVPYSKIATYAVCLVVPLAIGYAIQKWLPRVSRVLVRLLKPISTCLILFIVIFAIITNLYIFQLFSWQIVVAGLGLPWLGYILGWLLAKVLRQTTVDALTIAIETGVQNTGIAIFLLRVSLPQPQADLTTVVPVSVAIMTPFPLLGLYLFRRCTGRNVKEGTPEERTIVAADNEQQQHNQHQYT